MLLELLALNAANDASEQSSEALARASSKSVIPFFVKLQEYRLKYNSLFTATNPYLVEKENSLRLIPIGRIKSIRSITEDNFTYSKINLYNDDCIYSNLTLDELHKEINKSIQSALYRSK